MRISIVSWVLILFGFYAVESHSQNSTITIESKMALDIEQVFELIKSKTDYQFIYSYDAVKDAPKVNISKGLIKVSELLVEVLTPISCVYEFKDNHTIIVKRKNPKKSGNNLTNDSYKSSVKKKLTLKATLLDRATKQPIVFANIGFIKKGIGTISNEDGSFSLTFNKSLLEGKEILQISTLGYNTLKLNTKQLTNLISKPESNLFLNPEPFSLDQVLITNTKRKKVRLGNHRANSNSMGYWKDKKALGGEIAAKLNIRKQNTRLLDLKLNIIENLSDSIKIRINVYDYKKRYPSKKVLSDNIYHVITQKKGPVTVDLRPYNIAVSNDAVISIELIKVYGDIIDFSISAEPHSGIAFKRYVSQDKWKRFDYVGVNFSVLTSVPVRGSNKNQKVTLNEQDADVVLEEEAINTTNKINGTITYLGEPLKDATISIQGSNRGTKTDAYGNYQVNANIGEVLQYSHVGYRPIFIIVEDITKTINLEMSNNINELDEVVISETKSINNTSGMDYDSNNTVKTAIGDINPFLFPSKVYYFPKNDLNLDQFTTLHQALKWKMPQGKIPSIYDVDGVIFKGKPNLDLARILEVYVIEGSNGTAAWGGPVVIVKTMDDSEFIKKQLKEKIDSQKNQNFYNEDAIELETKKVAASAKSILKTIHGIITHINGPLANAMVENKNSTTSTYSNLKGYYQINAKTGDIIKFSYAGYQSISIIVEDVTSKIDIEMMPFTNKLDEVTVTAKNKGGKILERAKQAEKKFNTARGIVNPLSSGAITYISGEDLTPTNASFTDAIAGKGPGISKHNQRLIVKPPPPFYPYPIWDIDGQIYTEAEPPLYPADIEHIYVLKSVANTVKYGAIARGGVIVVITKSGTINDKFNSSKKNVNQFLNSNYYKNDATTIEANMGASNSYALELEALKDSEAAYHYYERKLKNTVQKYDHHITIAKTFIKFYNKKNYAFQLLKDLAKKHDKNPEILKAIAYYFQSIGSKNEAIKVYKSIFKLRPKYAQSYRDLANAFKENDQFKKAWRTYMDYLIQGNDLDGEGIGSLLYSEMEYLYFNRMPQTKIKEKFIPKNKTKEDFRNDVRFVFEWNTSEAEFDLEFVGPERRSYTFEHSLAKSELLIIDEKTRGYSSREFIINDVEDHEWLVNINYFGNKRPEPSYLKLTTYYHWGKPNQKEEIRVFKFQDERYKIQLLKINKQSLVAY